MVPHKVSCLYCQTCCSCISYRSPELPALMPALSTLKSNRTRAKNALTREEQEANELLQQEWISSSEQEL